MAKVVISEYNPEWAELYRVDSEAIREIFSEGLSEIHHIGSTAVQGMAARPVVDILAVVSDIALADERSAELYELGYVPADGEENPHKRAFYKEFVNGEETVRTHNLYIIDGECKYDLSDALEFVALLSTESEKAKLYSEIKIALAKEFSEDENTYNKLKLDRFANACKPESVVVTEEYKTEVEHEEERPEPIPEQTVTEQDAAEEPEKTTEKEPKKKNKKAPKSYVGIGASLLGTLGFVLGLFLNAGVVGLIAGMLAGGILGFVVPRTKKK